MGRIKKIIEKNQKNIIVYVSVLILCILICAPLLQFHITSDTYNFMDLGYFEYPSQFFLRDARIVSTMALYLGGTLNLPYEVFIIAMQIIAVIISATTIFCIYKTIEKRADLHSKSKIILTIMSAFIIVFNCMALEYLFYVECSVMCLSVLLSILSAIVITGKTRFRYLKALILFLISVFCYQGAVNIFLPMVLLLIFIEKEKRSIKSILKTRSSYSNNYGNIVFIKYH